MVGDIIAKGRLQMRHTRLIFLSAVSFPPVFADFITKIPEAEELTIVNMVHHFFNIHGCIN